MKLDSRILEGKKPLTCFDIEEAKQFVGKKGYFSNYLNVYTNLCNMEEGVLHSLDEQHGEAFVEEYAKWKFFLPEEWIKEPEKKYRAFSLNEFSELYAIGDVVTYRIKDCKVVEQAMLIGFQARDSDENIPGNAYVLIGNCRYSLKELFNNYELNYKNKWQPFGIEVEEK